LLGPCLRAVIELVIASGPYQERTMAEKQNLRKKIYDHEFTNGVSCQHPRVFLRHARF